MEQKIQTSSEVITAEDLERNFTLLADYNIEATSLADINCNALDEDEVDNFNAYAYLLVSLNN